jgi:hypothetical protein
VIKAASTLNPFKQAGFLIITNTHKIAVKSPQYVAAHSTILYANPGFGPMNLNADNIEQRTMIDLVAFGIAEEFVRYFPKWRSLYTEVKQVYLFDRTHT